jgi:phospholipase/carboxylesterase
MAASPTLSLIHLTQPPRAPSSTPPLLLLLHGVGSHEGDLIGLAPYLDGRFFTISARAPVVLAPGMYGWFHVVLDPIAPIINSDEAERSRQLLLEFIDGAVQAYRTDPRRVYLLGFSQGAIMSLSVALTRPEKLAGVVAMSGRVPSGVLPKMAPPEALRGLPILVVHGTEDPVLPIHHGRQTRDRLAAIPVALTYREYPMGHHVSEESLGDVAAWLQQRLDAPPIARLGHHPPGTNEAET